MSDRSTDERTRTVEISERTAERISNRISGTEFDSIDPYVTFALDQLLRELDRSSTDEGRAVPEVQSADDGAVPEVQSADDGAAGEAVQERLDSLGYL
jgi:hypothetical protein